MQRVRKRGNPASRIQRFWISLIAMSSSSSSEYVSPGLFTADNPVKNSRTFRYPKPPCSLAAQDLHTIATEDCAGKDTAKDIKGIAIGSVVLLHLECKAAVEGLKVAHRWTQKLPRAATLLSRHHMKHQIS